MKRLAHAVTLAAVTLGVAATTATAAAGSVPSELTVRLTLVAQTFVVGPGGSLSVTFRVGTGAEALAALEPQRVTLAVTAYPPDIGRDAVRRAIFGDLPPRADEVLVPATELARQADGTLRATVATEVGRDSPQAIRLAPDSLQPVAFEVRVDGRGAGRMISFVESVAVDPSTLPAIDGAPDGHGDLAVAVIQTVAAPPSRRPDGSSAIDAGVRDELTTIAQTLEASPKARLTLSVTPELLDALAASDTLGDRQLLERLRDAIGRSDLMARPYVDIDPSAAARAGLGEAYARSLADGEDTLSDQLPGTVNSRTVSVADVPIDAAGARLVRDLGGRLVVLLAGATASMNPDQLADAAEATASVVGLDAGSGPAIPGVIVDPLNADRLAQPGEDPVLTAFQMVAELVAERDSIAGGGRSLAGFATFWSANDGGAIDPAVLGVIIDLIDASPELRLVGAGQAASTTQPYTVGGRPLRLDLPAYAGADLSPTQQEMARLDQQIAETQSVLPADDPRPPRWRDIERVLPATQLSADQRAVYSAVIDAEAAGVRAGVVTESDSTFTLGGRSSDLQVSLRNHASVDLTVIVRVTSPKLRIAEPETLVTVPAGDTVRVPVAVDARTNGRFPVLVELLTPQGRTRLSPPVMITARVTALAGLAQVVTGALVVVLGTWWVHHLRRRRRERVNVRVVGHGTAPSAMVTDGADDTATLPRL